MLRREGTWSDDPDDPGEETCCGVSRRHHPGWMGWTLVEQAAARHNRGTQEFLSALRESKALRWQVERFYKVQYWDRFLGDMLPDQAVAEELLDTATNQGGGVHRAVTYLQRSLNLLNRQGCRYPDMIVDGLLGAVTLASLERFLEEEPSDILVKLTNIMQGARYIEITEANQRAEKYLRGWLARVDIGKQEA